MDLVDVSRQQGGFYVPAYEIRVDGEDLRAAAIAVSQVEADLILGGAGRFSFLVVNSYNDKNRAFLSGRGRRVLDLLRFGAEVEIFMGYGSKLQRVLLGLITEISTSFNEGGTPELTIGGSDLLFPLTNGKNTDSWPMRTDSEVVREIANRYQFDVEIETTTERHAQTEQNQESDAEFIKKLADRNHFEFYMDGETLHFHKPRTDGDGVVTLHWGKTLLSFKPEANLAMQVSKVEVYGWDPMQKRAFVGIAQAGDETGRDPQRASAGQLLRTRIGSMPVQRIRQPVFSQAEADARARAALDESAKKFLTGEGESIGLPQLRPDRNINLADLGEPFAKTYYLQQTTHKADGSGYRTRFKVKEPTFERENA
jgi:phage protein D